MAISFYLTLTSLGMLIKLWAFSIIRKNWQKTFAHYLAISLTCVLLVQSLLEFYSYLPYFKEHADGLIRGMRGYYVCFIFFVSIIPYIALSVTHRNIPSWLTWILLPYSAILTFLMLFTDSIISGVTPLGFTYTATKGPLYALFLILIFVSTGYTTHIFRKKNPGANNFVYIKSRNIYLSFLPFSIIIIGALIAMQLGAKINVLGILPVSIGIFTAAIANNIGCKYIVDYTYWIPFSKKRKKINRLVKPFISIQHDGLDPELKKEYNKILTQHALELFDGNQTKAAEWLKVSQSWVSRNNKNA